MVNNELDVAKKCYQVWQKVAKVAKKCYHGLPRPPTASHGLPRGSNGGFQGGFQGKVLPDVEKSHQRGSTGHGLERLPAVLAEGRQASTIELKLSYLKILLMLERTKIDLHRSRNQPKLNEHEHFPIFQTRPRNAGVSFQDQLFKRQKYFRMLFYSDNG